MIGLLKRSLLALSLLCLVGQPIAASAQDVGTVIGLAVRANAGAANAKVRSRSVPRIAVAGDSLTDWGKNTGTANQKQYTTTGYPMWLSELARGRFYTDVALNVALAGSKSDYLLATEVPAIIAQAPDIAIIQDGTNDVGVYTAAQTVANLTAAATALNAANIGVVFIAIAPQSAWNTAKRQHAAEANRQLWLLARDPARNIRFVDINPVYTDYGTGNALSGLQYTGDGVHDTPTGSLAKAQFILAAIDDLLPKASELLVMSSADAFDATLAPTGNLLVNGMMAGTAGTQSNGTFTNIPTSWLGGLGGSGGTPMTVVFSKGTDATYTTIPTSVMTFSGTADSNNAKLDQTITIPSGIVAGDKLLARCNVSWSGLTGMRTVGVRLTVTGDPSATAYEVYGGASFVPTSQAVQALPSAVSNLWRKAPFLVVPANAVNLRLRLEVTPISGSAVAGSVAWSRCEVRKVGQGVYPEAANDNLALRRAA